MKQHSAMGRPSASAENKVIAIEFAKAVTRKTSDPKDLLARCGRCSLFSALQEMFPQIVRDGASSARHGLTEAEFNKLLQVNIIDEICFEPPVATTDLAF